MQPDKSMILIEPFDYELYGCTFYQKRTYRVRVKETNGTKGTNCGQVGTPMGMSRKQTPDGVTQWLQTPKTQPALHEWVSPNQQMQINAR